MNKEIKMISNTIGYGGIILQIGFSSVVRKDEINMNWKRIFLHAAFIYSLSFIGGVYFGYQESLGNISQYAAAEGIKNTNIGSIVFGTMIITSVYRPNSRHYFGVWMLLFATSIPNLLMYSVDFILQTSEALALIGFCIVIGNFFGIPINIFLLYVLKKFYRKNI